MSIEFLISTIISSKRNYTKIVCVIADLVVLSLLVHKIKYASSSTIFYFLSHD